MNLPVLIIVVSAVFLLQVVTVMCMLEDSGLPNELPLRSWSTLQQIFGKDKPKIRDKSTTEKNLHGTLPAVAGKERDFTERANLPGVKKDIANRDDQVLNPNYLPLGQQNKEAHNLLNSDVDLPQIRSVLSMATQDVSADTQKHDAKMKVSSQQLTQQNHDMDRVNSTTQKNYDMDRVNSTTQLNNDMDRVNSALSHKAKSGSLKHGQIRMNKRVTDIYQLKGFDGDKGRVKFEKRIVKPKIGQKEINWIIRIKQIVDNSFINDGSNAEEVVKEDGKRLNLADEKKGNTKDSKDADEKTSKLKTLENRNHRRHLMQDKGKENSDVVNFQNALTKNDNKAIADSSESNDEDNESELANVAIIGRNDLKDESGKQDQMSEQTQSINNRLGNKDLSFLLKQNLQNQLIDPQNMESPASIISEKMKDDLLDEAVDRLEAEYNINFLRSKNNNNKDYDRKDDDEAANDGAKISDLIKDGERDEKLLQRSQGLKVDKRSVQDVTGNYGVSVDDDDDDGVPKEYDVLIENGIKEVRLPRETKKRKVRRQSGKQSTVRPSSEHEGNTRKYGNQMDKTSSPFVTTGNLGGEDAIKNFVKVKQHNEINGDNFMNANGGAKIIEVGYIYFINKGLEKAVTHNISSHHRRPCNDSHGAQMGSDLKDGTEHNKGHHSDGVSKHPCHHDHRKHHTRTRNTKHHLSGRKENHQTDGYKSDNQNPSHQVNDPHSVNHNRNEPVNQLSDHVSHHLEDRLPDITNTHEQVTLGVPHKVDHAHEKGEIVVETFRSESVNGVPGTHSHTAHSGNAIHVLVILSIFLIFFTTIIFVIMKSRSGSGRVREMNSRTALYIPQAKY